MSLIIKRTAVLILGSAAVSACAAPSSSVGRTSVEIRRGGDDGLTVRFADALEAAFRRAPGFSLGSGKVADTLIVTIPSNVTWKQTGDRTQVNYSIMFSTIDSQPVGSSSGTCWEDQLQQCIDHVLEDAKAVKKNLD